LPATTRKKERKSMTYLDTTPMDRAGLPGVRGTVRAGADDVATRSAGGNSVVRPMVGPGDVGEFQVQEAIRQAGDLMDDRQSLAAVQLLTPLLRATRGDARLWWPLQQTLVGAAHEMDSSFGRGNYTEKVNIGGREMSPAIWQKMTHYERGVFHNAMVDQIEKLADTDPLAAMELAVKFARATDDSQVAIISRELVCDALRALRP
jgi:hypothetical protein